MVKRWIRKIVDIATSRSSMKLMKYPQTEFVSFSPLDLAITALSLAPSQDRRFVLVGANDGVFGDYMEKYTASRNWRGILVEPQPDVFAKLTHNLKGREGLIFENAAIGPQCGEVRLYRAPSSMREINEYASTVTSYRPEVAARQLGISISELESVNVPCMTLDSLVAKHNFQGFSVLVIDCEGADYEILRSLSLLTTPPKVIQFEHGHLSAQEITESVRHLTAHRYQVNYGGYQTDTVAIHESFWPDLRRSMIGEPQTSYA